MLDRALLLQTAEHLKAEAAPLLLTYDGYDYGHEYARVAKALILIATRVRHVHTTNYNTSPPTPGRRPARKKPKPEGV